MLEALRNAPYLAEPDLHTAFAEGKLGRTLCIARVANDAYHRGPGVSSTDLKLLLQSPAHYAAAKLKPWKCTPALRFGTATHEAMFEPELYDGKYVVTPQALDDANKSKNPWKAEWSKFKELAETEGKEILSFYEAQDIRGIVYTIFDARIWKQQVGPAEPIFELAFYWVCDKTGILLKAKLDILAWSLGMILDLKTTDDVRFFRSSVRRYNYHVSAAHYLKVVSNATKHQVDNFAWIAMEKEAPYGHKFIIATPATLAKGRELADEAVLLYKDCVAAEAWPAYSDTWEELDITTTERLEAL